MKSSRALNTKETFVKFRTLGILLVLVLMAVFLIINWTTLSQVTTVNLVYTEIQAPLGILVVCGFSAIIVLLGIYTIWQQASVLIELRSAYKEARRAHQLAEEADKSRVTEATKEMKTRFEHLEAVLTGRSDESMQLMRERLDALEKKLAETAADNRTARETAKAEIFSELKSLQKRVADVLPAPAAEVADETKKKEVFGDLF